MVKEHVKNVYPQYLKIQTKIKVEYFVCAYQINNDLKDQ